MEVILPTVPKPGKNGGFDKIVAVDGCSVHCSVGLLEEYCIPIVAQSQLGHGEAILQALQAFEADACILLSPDGNEAITGLPRFRLFLENGADIVIPSQMMEGAHNEENDQILRWRKWANNTFNLLANLIFRRSGPFITDSSLDFGQ